MIGIGDRVRYIAQPSRNLVGTVERRYRGKMGGWYVRWVGDASLSQAAEENLEVIRPAEKGGSAREPG